MTCFCASLIEYEHAAISNKSASGAVNERRFMQVR